MATWKPAPNPANGGGDSPITGKFPYGEALHPALNQQPPAWKSAPAGSSLLAPSAIGYPI